MSRLFDVVPRQPASPSLVIRDAMPPYTAPRFDAAPVLRPFSIAAGGSGVVTTPDAAYDDATGVTPPGGAAGDDGCGCGK